MFVIQSLWDSNFGKKYRKKFPKKLVGQSKEIKQEIKQ